MPVMDGISCTREIRRLEAAGVITRHIPIIAVTAYARAAQVENARAAGVVSPYLLTLPHLTLPILPTDQEMDRQAGRQAGRRINDSLILVRLSTTISTTDTRCTTTGRHDIQAVPPVSACTQDRGARRAVVRNDQASERASECYVLMHDPMFI